MMVMITCMWLMDYFYALFAAKFDMSFSVVCAAQPNDIKWFRVIVVMGIHRSRSAPITGLRDENSSEDCAPRDGVGSPFFRELLRIFDVCDSLRLVGWRRLTTVVSIAPRLDPMAFHFLLKPFRVLRALCMTLGRILLGALFAFPEMAVCHLRVRVKLSEWK